ncbi:hypothetical protein NH340_JMT08538 [Sarcoptes scabiei]|nr:hypothetical protein NH340_JMT08538 [Sarcoptes scabiei]
MILLDQFLMLFWSLLSIGIFVCGYATIHYQSFVPRFIQKLVLYGKFHSLRNEDVDDNDGGGGGDDGKIIIPYNCFASIDAKLVKFVEKFEVPKCWFRHFYIVSLLINLFLMTMIDLNRWSCCLLIIAQLIQSIRRLYETCLVSIYSGNTINLVHYLVGILFYLTLGYGTYRTSLVETQETNHLILSWWLLIFLIFSFVQYKSHLILANIRLPKKEKVCKDRYAIPKESLFNHITCPHYLSEIIIYYCLFEFSQQSVRWFIIWLFVLSNQTIAALLSHRWYQNHFGEIFPPNLNALIPFI